MSISLSRAFASVIALAVPALAQERPGPLTLTVHPLKGGVYWVEGGSSNTGFVVGDKGVVVIDAQMTVDAAKMAMGKVAGITTKPIDTIVLTHADPDHVGGLPAYPAGATIIAHENVKSSIQVAAANGARWGAMMMPLYRAVAATPPTRTIAETQPMTLDGVRAMLIHVAPAHTSGDLIVYLPAQKIAFSGDIVTTNIGVFPIIHPGGSTQGWIESMKALLALNADVYVPGHGAIETRAMLQTRLGNAEQRRADVKAMVEAKKSRAEVLRALPDSVPGGRFATFTETAYDELTSGYPPAAQ